MRKEPSMSKALKSRITDQQSIAITFAKTLGNHHRFARILKFESVWKVWNLVPLRNILAEGNCMI